LAEGAADISPVPQLSIDERGFLISANQAARRTFGLGRADVGRPLQDLEISYRPVELRASLHQDRDSRDAVQVGNVTWRSSSGQETVFEVVVAPVLGGDDGATLGASVTFTDVTAYSQLDEQHKVVERQLEGAYEELQSTVEELETTNEELQST